MFLEGTNDDYDDHDGTRILTDTTDFHGFLTTTLSQVFYRYTKNAEARHHQHHGSRDEQGTDEAGCEGVGGVMAADGGGRVGLKDLVGTVRTNP